eukprot:7019123-Prorocentrum_lima.AAC.1
MEEKCKKYCEDPNQDTLRTLDEAEEVLIGNKSYQACQEFGEKQVEYLKALDFMDMLTEDLL